MDFETDFNREIDRRGTNSYKWDSRPDIPQDTIPLWVADMDFKAAPPILRALERRVSMGVFGYTFVPRAYYEAITGWFDRYHRWHIPAEQVIYTSGVVPAISAIIKALTRHGQKVLVQTPVYNCFFSSIRNNGCEALEAPLRLDGRSYSIDFDVLEQAASDPECTLMLLCNPHNPAGRVWTPDELKRIDGICSRNGVTVVSDEIHCELVYGGKSYTPYANINPQARHLACISPSKAFNIAGLQIANIVVPDPDTRRLVDRAINDNEVCDVNPFGVDALIAAYTQGRPWLDALLEYIHGNYLMLRDVFDTHLPLLKVIDLEGTYLAWVDCRAIDMPTEQLEEHLIQNAGVWINAGSMYHGEGFIRINLACPRHRLRQALDRMIPVLRSML